MGGVGGLWVQGSGFRGLVGALLLRILWPKKGAQKMRLVFLRGYTHRLHSSSFFVVILRTL